MKISSHESAQDAKEPRTERLSTRKTVLRETPPEISADVMDKGMILTGGGAQLRNIDQYISQAIGVPCFVADDPLMCVVKGTGIVLDNLDVFKRGVMSKK